MSRPPLPLPAAVVVDVEATCWEPTEHPALAANQHNECEIIEIGAVWHPLGDAASFRALVRPRRHPQLSRFCTELTGLTQRTVDVGQTFPEAYSAFLDWCGAERCVVASWGSFDARQFARDCQRHGLPPPSWRSVNLKPWFARVARSKGAPNQGRMSLVRALDFAGIGFEGTPHRAVSDAYNTARLVEWANRALVG